MIKTAGITDQQSKFFVDHGWLHVPGVFDADETTALASALDELIDRFAVNDQGWTGAWRKAYMDEETEKASKLIALHDLHLYSDVWARHTVNPRLAEVLSGLLGPLVEFHHSTLHVKPPETGHPFPMHQDYPFYPHTDDRFVAVLVHLDDTFHENGEIRFLDGSHKSGPLEHIEINKDGTPCTPFLPTDKYSLEDTVAVPAKAGDIVCFSINTIHGSHINTTPNPRRLVRMGFREPSNVQLSGQSHGRTGIMVKGMRPKS